MSPMDTAVKSRRSPRGIVGYRPRFNYSWTSELDVRAAVKAGERKKAAAS
jgi:hypothetical protein